MPSTFIERDMTLANQPCNLANYILLQI